MSSFRQLIGARKRSQQLATFRVPASGTLSADAALTIDEPGTNEYGVAGDIVLVDPGAVARTLKLPPEARFKGRLAIINIGTADVTIKDSTGVTTYQVLPASNASDALMYGAASGTYVTEPVATGATVADLLRDSTTLFYDNGDSTKRARFECSGITAAATRVMTIPDSDFTFVGTTLTQTLTNKTLDNTSTITVKDANLTIQDDADATKQLKLQASGITAGQTRTLTVPDSSDTIVVLAATQTLSNKTLDNTCTTNLADTRFTVEDDGDTTKKARFQCSSITAGQTRLMTIPDSDFTFVGVALTQTLTNKTLDNTCTVTLKDTLFTVQDDADATKQFRVQVSGVTAGQTRVGTVPDADFTFVGLATTQTLSNKTLDNTCTVTIKDTLLTVQDDADATKQFRVQVSGVTAGQTRVGTVPDADFTFVGLATTQTLTNKTLDNTNTVELKDTLFTLQDDGDATKKAQFQLSSITAGQTRVITVPDSNMTLVGMTLTQTLTNKTLDNTNTVELKDTLFTLQDDGDATKKAQFQLSGITAGQTRTFTLPDVSDTVVVLAATQTLSSKTLGVSNTVTLRDDRFTLQDDADATKQGIFQMSSVTAGNTRTITWPDFTVNLNTGPFSEDTDVVVPISTSLKTDITGTWTRSRVGVANYRVRRTAAAAIETMALEVPTSRLRSAATRGLKVTGAKIQYEISTAVINDFTIAGSYTVIPATGAAIAAASSLGAVTYDAAHDTIAERVTVAQHTIQVTFAAPVYLADGFIELLFTCDGTATGVLDINQVELLCSQTLIDSV